jgi:hypothetical protein
LTYCRALFKRILLWIEVDLYAMAARTASFDMTSKGMSLVMGFRVLTNFHFLPSDVKSKMTALLSSSVIHNNQIPEWLGANLAIQSQTTTRQFSDLLFLMFILLIFWVHHGYILLHSPTPLFLRIDEAVGTERKRTSGGSSCIQTSFKVASRNRKFSIRPLFQGSSNEQWINCFSIFVIKSRRRAFDELHVPSMKGKEVRGKA